MPVNVTLLFSTADYLAAAEAYMRGLEKRVEAGLDPDVRSVASVFISRWDRAIVEQVPDELKNKLGIAVGQHAYRAYRDLIASDRWQRLENARRAPAAALVRQHVEQGQARHRHALYRTRSPRRIPSTPCRRTRCAPSPTTAASTACCRADGGDCDAVLAAHEKAGVDVDALAQQLQSDGAKAFVASWQDLLKSIGAKSKALA